MIFFAHYSLPLNLLEAGATAGAKRKAIACFDTLETIDGGGTTTINGVLRSLFKVDGESGFLPHPKCFFKYHFSSFFHHALIYSFIYIYHIMYVCVYGEKSGGLR